MDKKTYYVSVQAGDILEDPEAAAFEFEIEATDDQVSRLQEMMDEWSDGDSHSVKAMFNFLDHEQSQEPRAEEYSIGLVRVYKLIHELGTQETKRHIESMDILEDNKTSANPT